MINFLRLKACYIYCRPSLRSIPLSLATQRTGHDNSTIFLYRFLKSALWCQEDHAKYKNIKLKQSQYRVLR